MTVNVTVGVVAFVCGVVCAIVGTVVVFAMVDRVNERLPEERQFSPIGWYPSKYQRLFAEYRRLYPNGSHISKFRFVGVLLFGCMFLSAWGLGFFSR